jgi:hypothetical protein
MATHAFHPGHRETIRARGRVGMDSSFRETRASGLPAGTATARVNTEPTEQLGVTRIVASDLYLDSEVLSPALVSALTLLTQALRLVGEGIQLLPEDPLAADLNVQSLRPVLRKLFMSRQIGDGFGAVVDSLISALDNNRGMPLSERRFAAVHNVLLKLHDEPFLSFSSAINVIEDIERAGFSTEPPGFEQLADWLTVY